MKTKRTFGLIYANLENSNLNETQMRLLPVKTYADDDCLLLLLAENEQIPLALKLIESWGFVYVTQTPWIRISREKIEEEFEPLRVHNRVLLMGRRGYIVINEEPMVGYLDEEHENIYRYIEFMTSHTKLELFATKEREEWHRWGLHIDSTIDILKGLPKDYLVNAAMHELYLRINDAWNQSEQANWLIGDAMIEMERMTDKGLIDICHTVLQQMHNMDSREWPRILYKVALSFPAHERESSKRWYQYRNKYEGFIRAAKKREKEKQKAFYDAHERVQQLVGGKIW